VSGGREGYMQGRETGGREKVRGRGKREEREVERDIERKGVDFYRERGRGL
jgi:hypothetical protein